jgi:hypothetical protein
MLGFTYVGRGRGVRICLVSTLGLALGRFVFKPLELFLLLPMLCPLSLGFLKIVVRLSHLHLGPLLNVDHVCFERRGLTRFAGAGLSAASSLSAASRANRSSRRWAVFFAVASRSRS